MGPPLPRGASHSCSNRLGGCPPLSVSFTPLFLGAPGPGTPRTHESCNEVSSTSGRGAPGHAEPRPGSWAPGCSTAAAPGCSHSLAARGPRFSRPAPRPPALPAPRTRARGRSSSHTAHRPAGLPRRHGGGGGFACTPGPALPSPGLPPRRPSGPTQLPFPLPGPGPQGSA